MSFIFYLEYFIIIFSLLNIVNNKMKNPPIEIWDKTLSEYFSNHNISNYINIEPKKCINNESYYLFVMQTILKFNDVNDEVETLGYTGFCLKEYNITPVEHSLINSINPPIVTVSIKNKSEYILKRTLLWKIGLINTDIKQARMIIKVIV